ncbi:MAG: hypothetical protein V4492_05710 [Chlamydiota bacterium]
MKIKLIISLLLLATGVYFIVDGINLTPQEEPHRDVWGEIDNFFSNNPMWNPLVEFFGGTPIQETPKPSKVPSIVNIVIGALIILAGVAVSLYPRKKQK